MTILYNKRDETIKRKILRNNSPFCERLIWKHLKASQMGHKFRRQYGFGTYVVDFYCPTKRVVVEIDGPSHDLKLDEVRQIQIETLNIKFLRFTNDQVLYEREAVIEMIKKSLE